MLQNNSNDPVSELMRNKATLKKVNRFFNVASLVYVLTCLVYAGVSVFMIILSVSGSFFDTFFMFLDGIVLKAAVLYFGYQSCYKHDNRLTFVPPAIQGIDFAIMSAVSDSGIGGLIGAMAVTMNLVYLAVYTFFSILIVIHNKEYNRLEKLEGFPYFNERVEKEKKERQKFENDNPFTKRKEELEKNSSDDMDLLDYSQKSDDNGINDARGMGTMDEI